MISANNNQDTSQPDRLRVLIVCTWPLGGIRTFLKYNYRHFPKDRFDIILLANPTLERESVAQDFKEEGIPVVWTKSGWGRHLMFARIYSLVRRNKIDCIHSQGFTSAFHSAVANWWRRRPHVLTMHGILEPKYFQGMLGSIKRLIFRKVLSNVSVFHAVGQDMLDHFQRELPSLASASAHRVVIRNGVDTTRFGTPIPEARPGLRKLLDCPEDTFVFGYFGRFMPEKGFDLLVRATELLIRNGQPASRMKILAMGSGDYEAGSKRLAADCGLSDTIHFHPFQANVEQYLLGCDAVVIPSRHEAFPLLPCEALSGGIPVIASNAMGLREAVRDTPTICFPVDDTKRLAEAMAIVINDKQVKARFTAFKATAAERFEVRHSAEKLVELLTSLSK
jgi:glycosyltransferase involved in cell wall biosynthesis